jgi:predicted MFS family arabinose efflux permease
MRWQALNPWRDLAGLPRALWAVALATLVNRAGTMVLPFLALHLTRNLGLTPARAGQVLAAYGLSALASSPFVGLLGDRFGPLRVSRASLAGSAALMFALPRARDAATVTALLVALAAVAEAMRPATLALVGSIAGPADRRRAFALNRLAVNLGMSVGPAVGGVLADASFGALFAVDGATSLLAALALGLVDPAAGAAARAGPRAPGARPAGPAFRDRRLVALLAALLPVSAVFFQHQGTMALYVVRDLGLSTSFYGALFTLNTALVVLGEVRLNAATARWPVARALAAGALLATLGFAGLALCTGPRSVAATVVVWTLGEMILFPTSSARVAELAPDERRGEYMGYYSMAFGLSFTAGPWLGSFVYERWGGRALWWLCLPAGLVSVALLARLGAGPARASARDQPR